MVSVNLSLFLLLLFVVTIVFFVVKIKKLSDCIDGLQYSLSRLNKRISELEKDFKIVEENNPDEHIIGVESCETQKDARIELKNFQKVADVSSFEERYPKEGGNNIRFWDCLKTFFEEYVASKIFLWLGGLALIFAGFFLAKYSIEQGLLSPIMRITLTAVFALGLFVSAEIFKRKNEKFLTISAILFASSVAVAYGDFYAAGQYYNIISSSISFWGSVVVSTLAMVSIRRYGSGMIYLASFGALLAPAIFTTENPSVLMLLAYLLVVSVLTLKICVAKNAVFQILFLLLGNVVWIIAINSNLSNESLKDFQWFIWYMVAVAYMFFWAGKNIDVASYCKQFPRIFENVNEYVYEFISWIVSHLIISIGLIVSYYNIVKYFHVGDNLSMYNLLLAYCLLASLAILGGIKSLSCSFISIIASIGLAVFAIQYDDKSMYMQVGMFCVCVASVFAYFKKKIFACIALCVVGVISSTSIDCYCSFMALMAIVVIYLLERKFNICGSRRVSIVIGNIILISIITRCSLLDSITFLYLSAVVVANVGFFYLLKDVDFNSGIRTIFCLFFPVLVLSVSFGVCVMFASFQESHALDNFGSLAIFTSALFVGFLLIRKRTENTFIEKLSNFSIPIFFALGLLFAIANAMFYFFGTNSMFASRGISISLLALIALLVHIISERIGALYIRYSSYILIFSVWILALVNVVIAMWNRIYISGYPIVNASIFALLVPAMLTILFYNKASEKIIKNISIVGTSLLLFVFANVELKLCFVDNFINTSPSPALYYSYSALWLFMGVALLALGRVNVCFRYLSLCLVLVAVSKVFIFDAANLDGILRVASFAMLGVVLIGIGYVYKRYILK